LGSWEAGKIVVNAKVNAKLHDPPVGQVLRQRYEIVRLLASGAFGHTYVARDLEQSGAPCLIKHYQSHRNYPHLLKTSRRIFATEAETLKQLGAHDQIPRFIDCFEADEQFYLVQELIVGQPLSDEMALLQRAPVRVRQASLQENREAEVIYFLRDLLQVLDFVHSQGIIHCDVKPNNILRRAKDGKLVLVDFGAAQSIRSPERDRELIGTLPLKSTVAVSPSGYLAAEQLVGKPYANSDIYAVGIMAIQMLTGIDPAKLQLNLETNELNWQQIQTRYPSKSSLYRPLTAILRQMVRYNHQQRYRSAQEVLRALEPLLEPARRSLLQASEPASVPPATEPTPEPELAPAAEAPPEIQAPPTGQPASSPEAANFQDWEDWQEARETNGTAAPESAAAAELETASALAPTARQLSPWQISPALMATLTRAGLAVAVLNVLAIAAGVYTLADQRATDPGARRFAKASRAFQNGDLDSALALARAVPSDSDAYEASQQAVEQWQQDWSRAAQQVSAAEQAFAQQDWGAVLAASEQIPNIDYWQEKVAPLVATANERAEDTAKQLLAQASSAAYNRNFTQALEYLRQIPPRTTIGQRIQPKIEEYTRKEQIRAMYFLQRAYDRAEQGDFKAAIAELQQIPDRTPAGSIARQKLIEYAEKQSAREKLANSVDWATPTPIPEAAPPAAASDPTATPGNSAESFIEMPANTSSSLNPGQQLREAAA